jgi:hypothetical protein
MRTRSTFPMSRSQTLERPFAGQGVSVYVDSSLPLQRKNLITLSALGHSLLFSRPSKTTRIASDTGTANDALEIAVDLTGYTSPVWIDVAHYRDDRENDAAHPQLIHFDEAGDLETVLLGRAILVSVTPRTAGTLWIDWQWIPSATGLVPTHFELRRTAGPTSPAAIRISNDSDPLQQFVIPNLEDSSTYNFTIYALHVTPVEDDDPIVVERLLLEIDDVQADASGPPAVTVTSTEAV